MNLALAIVLGTLFGFVLQRIGAADPDRILGMLRLTDAHLARTILLGIGVSAVLLASGLALGLVDPGHIHVKSLYPGVLAGGLIFGVGWAVSGYCPGTGIVALGAGRKDAFAFVLGGLAGAGAFLLSYGHLVGTGLFEPLLGGSVALAPAGRFHALVPGTAGTLLAIALGVAWILLARFLPGSGTGPDAD